MRAVRPEIRQAEADAVRRPPLRCAVAWTLVTTLLTWTGSGLATPATAKPPTTPLAGAPSVDRGLPPLPRLRGDRKLDLVAARDGAFAVADRYDPGLYFVDDLLDRLDYEPKAAFTFVRDEIRFDPYAGVLRGAEGTLGAHAGNALDRSLLLVRLLEDMGVDARLVHGRLSEKRARRLLAHALDVPDSPFDIEPLARLAGFIPEVRARLQARAVHDEEWLRHALGTRLKPAAPALTDADSLRDHVWVQAKLGGGWQDLDTSFPDAKPGKRYAEPIGYDHQAPAGAFQRVKLAVIEERLVGSKLEQREVLQLELEAASAARERIYLAFLPVNPGVGGTLASKLGQATRFKPVILVNGERHVGRAIAGIPRPRTESEEFLLGSGGKEQLSALYLDVETSSPDHHTTTSRRCLLDRVPSRARFAGTAKTRDLAPVDRIDGVPTVFHAIHQVIVSSGSLNPHQVANNVGLAAHFAGRHLSRPHAFRDLDLDAIMWPVAMLRSAAVAWDERTSVGVVDDLPDLRFVIAEPRVYLVSLLQLAAGAQPQVAVTVDLVHDEVQAVAAGHVSPSEVASARMRYGVFQSAFETTWLELPRMVTGGAPDAGLRGASATLDGKGVVLASRTDRHLPPDAPAALLDHLEHGGLVVAGTSQLAHGAQAWWAVSPDGTTRAMLAPTLGGVTDYTWWKNYTDSRPARITHTDYHPDMSGEEIRAEANRAVQEALEEAYEEGGGKAAAERVSRGGELPRPARARGGETEDTLMTEASIWMTMPSIFFGLVAAATFTVAFIALAAFVAIYTHFEKKQKGRLDTGEPVDRMAGLGRATQPLRGCAAARSTSLAPLRELSRTYSLQCGPARCRSTA